MIDGVGGVVWSSSSPLKRMPSVAVSVTCLEVNGSPVEEKRGGAELPPRHCLTRPGDRQGQPSRPKLVK